MPLTPTCLWIVATPIGNPGDISSRARNILASADVILAEDTRRAASLFASIGIKPKKILSFFEHNETARQPEAMAWLKDGKSIALVTDAGTPLMADPGYRLVQACREAGIKVSPVPGPSAPIAALSAAGLPPIPFSFLGFMPKAFGAKLTLLKQFANIPGSIIFFERKNRLPETLEAAYKAFGNRQIAICRELTKLHEEFISGSLENRNSIPDNLLGEITVIIAPPSENERAPRENVVLLVDQAIDDGLKPRVAAKLISEKCPGWSPDEIYELMQEIKDHSDL